MSTTGAVSTPVCRIAVYAALVSRFRERSWRALGACAAGAACCTALETGGLGLGLGGLETDARADGPGSGGFDKRDAPVKPPDDHRPFLQYGVAFTIEHVLAAGPICPDPSNPCILGSGGGIAARAGWRPTERFYIGGSYELSKQDPNKLYLLGILQQVRAEVRNYFPTGNRTTPFVLAGAGVAGYGDEWSVDTWGASACIGGGLEVQLSGGSLIGMSVLYRPIWLRSFVDSSTASHNAGIVQFLGLELAVEAQDAL
jgi:hypothetical protein